VLPAFAFYDDYDGKNAYATPLKRLERVDGTVLMGAGLLQELRSKAENPEVTVAGVCAHEFGHILQYRHKLLARLDAGQRTVKRGELQADYFAGYFAGLRKRERREFPAAVIALTQFEFGDLQYNDPGHHGTPKERGDAVSKGFEASFRQNKSLGEAIEESTSYAMSL
jgi:predicted metalloprotease